MQQVSMTSDVASVELLLSWRTTGKIKYADIEGRSIESEWSRDRRSAFIESILMGLPVAPIVCNAGFNGDITLYDGRNRIYALESFILNGFKLKNLKVLTTYNGLFFKELPPYIKSHILNYEFNLCVIGPNTPKELVCMILERVNLRPTSTKAKRKLKNDK